MIYVVDETCRAFYEIDFDMIERVTERLASSYIYK